MAENDDNNPDDVEDENTPDDVEDEGSEGDDDSEEEWKPPTKEEHERMQKALKARKVERDKARNELRQLKSKDKPTPEEDAETKADLRVKRLAGVAALAGEGLTKEQAKIAVNLLDLSDVEVDEDGDADLSEQIEALKEKFPRLFEKNDGPSSRRRPNGRPRQPATPMNDATKKMLQQAGYATP